ncbi:MAG: S1-like domain-containing RNA-binding protein [Verrucomicrobiales bacterium]|nr:S1-like domain-containing RNA-binding protein [Verrucomicrobiales bacterium]
MAALGKTNHLIIVRDSDFGFYLDGGDLGEILLPNAEVPDDVEQGDEVEVFVARDSEDRIVATTQKPICEVGQFAALEVKSVNQNVGAFLDWGLPKDLLLPFREQVFPVRAGQRIIVRVALDEVSNRIIASTRTNRYLNQSRPRYDSGDAVKLIIQERTPLGYMAIVDQQFRGLLHESRIQRPLRVGEEIDGFIAALKEDDKIDLSLEPVGYGRVTDLSGKILALLEEKGGRINLGDKSSPEEIQRVFGTSKKAFKQALGALYRERKIRMVDGGIEKA